MNHYVVMHPECFWNVYVHFYAANLQSDSIHTYYPVLVGIGFSHFGRKIDKTLAMTLLWKMFSEVIAPGPDKKGEQPAKIRLYSIASSAVGDNENSQTVSLCALCCK